MSLHMAVKCCERKHNELARPKPFLQQRGEGIACAFLLP